MAGFYQVTSTKGNMKLKLRIVSTNPCHTRIAVYYNGANCGELCFRHNEAVAFIDKLKLGEEVDGMERLRQEAAK